MAEKEKETERVEYVRKGVVKYTKPPENKVPPSQRARATEKGSQ
jgi:hypothetical protein